MSLKDKPLKKCHTDKRKMIDDLHKEIILNIDEKSKLNVVVVTLKYKVLNLSMYV